MTNQSPSDDDDAGRDARLYGAAEECVADLAMWHVALNLGEAEDTIDMLGNKVYERLESLSRDDLTRLIVLELSFPATHADYRAMGTQVLTGLRSVEVMPS